MNKTFNLLYHRTYEWFTSYYLDGRIVGHISYDASDGISKAGGPNMNNLLRSMSKLTKSPAQSEDYLIEELQKRLGVEIVSVQEITDRPPSILFGTHWIDKLPGALDETR